MRIAIALVLTAALVGGCSKKKPPVSPANAAPAAEAPGGAEGGEVKDEAKPDDQDDAGKLGADPCDGGE